MFGSDMPEQASKLVQKLKSDRLVSMEKGWKFITMLVGGNDLCQFCEDPVSLCAQFCLQLRSDFEPPAKSVIDHNVDQLSCKMSITIFPTKRRNYICCLLCLQDAHDARSYAAHIQEALDILQQHVPRALVNIVSYFDLTQITDMSESFICDTLHVSVMLSKSLEV